MENTNLETATFAGGCFWCTEAVYSKVKGVESVTSGYSGGDLENPTDKEVYTGKTGHAEAVQIKYDPNVTSYKNLLEIFFKTHDPTSLNKQGHDIGPMYRSAIFYSNENQKNEAEDIIKKLDESKYYDNPIVTTVESLRNFYPAEDYHQKFYETNGSYPYCRIVIDPKIKKLEELFNDKLKSSQ